MPSGALAQPAVQVCLVNFWSP